MKKTDRPKKWVAQRIKELNISIEALKLHCRDYGFSRSEIESFLDYS